MGRKLISVLVPVYDTGSWLQNCLESIAAQTYRNLEVILVDDGSADGSRETCERFCREDPRFRLISQEHLGVSAARNAALDAAQGDYIYFADADDYLSPHALEVLHAALRSGPYDMATADFLKPGPAKQLLRRRRSQATGSFPARIASGNASPATTSAGWSSGIT